MVGFNNFLPFFLDGQTDSIHLVGSPTDLRKTCSTFGLSRLASEILDRVLPTQKVRFGAVFRLDLWLDDAIA
jgi:hypothetical protein